MGVFRFLKSLVDSEAMGDEIIRVQEKAYNDAKKLYPDSDPHALLAQVWLSRMAAHGKNIDNEAMQMTAFSETMQFACVPPPGNVRALGLYFIYKERPDIIEKHPKFGLEFQKLMRPVFKAMKNGSIGALYKKYNPNMEED
ncbi:MAG TPA: hypothetical protein EYP21_10895 [Syntrophaceae bacterium]|nr:hypothetical protein [Syntrophaceae bacterium]